ncbi:class I SAM-dependent methyltransferase [Nostocoides sp. HKS02]|uniref:class I SAM-dependent methyltransferase n=1 Tax=Nostocoides sp. HKS02 TaxID=1813880 RepID=UPI0012B48935|nr:class I SAM-dependent methyltransferase [Tetrasphaera sp. HKS02]QGN57951.1 methyltransferase domain-containing protein [Tetrasphaera sp. HKS02]
MTSMQAGRTASANLDMADLNITSVTHAHLLACVNTELLARAVPGRTLRILDAGCGNGELIRVLDVALSAWYPDCLVEVYGYDVGDHGVQSAGFFDSTVRRLSEESPSVDWTERLHLIGASSGWPFPDEYFDIVVSNQVLEHVDDHLHFFKETRRALKQGGVALHLFPLRHYLWEGHLHLPLVHRIQSHDLRYAAIKRMSQMGIGPFRKSKAAGEGRQLADYSELHADYVWHWTNYLTESQVYALARQVGLRASLRYTPEFYVQKLRQLRRKPAVRQYDTEGRALTDALGAKCLRYASSVTVRLESTNSYHLGVHGDEGGSAGSEPRQ